MMHSQRQRGMTLIEAMIAIAILSTIMLGVTFAFAALWKMQGFTMRLGLASQQATHALTTMTTTIRGARRADSGAYPVVAADATSFTFYADDDHDGATERVRYFRVGSTLRKGIVEPSATQPVTYDGAETVSTIAKDIVDNADGTPLFAYYDGTNAALAATPPVDAVRMVRLTITVDTDPNAPPTGVVLSSFASLRNLREW